VLPHVEEHIRRSSENDGVGRDMPGCVSLDTDSIPAPARTETGRPKEGYLGTKTRVLTLVWTVRHEGFIDHLARRELRVALSRQDVDFHLHTTSHVSSSSFPPAQPDETTGLLVPTPAPSVDAPPPPVKIKSGRPDIGKILAAALSSRRGVEDKGAKTAVLVCGPAEMADETRSVVRKALARGYTRLDYFEEAFRW
jgi:hypothetical protein